MDAHRDYQRINLNATSVRRQSDERDGVQRDVKYLGATKYLHVPSNLHHCVQQRLLDVVVRLCRKFVEVHREAFVVRGVCELLGSSKCFVESPRFRKVRNETMSCCCLILG